MAENLDGTKYAANARHRLNEIDRAIEAGIKPPTYFEGVADSVQPQNLESEPPADDEIPSI